MGLFRSGLFVIASVLLFVAFLTANVFLTLNKSLEYEIVKPELVSVIKDIFEDKINLSGVIDENFEYMQLYCKNNSEFVFNEQGHTFAIPCSVISHGSDAVIEYGASSLVDEFYYKDYNCNFWDCFGKTEIPFFLVSKKAKDYWENKFYFLMLVSFILIILMFFLVERKANLFVVTGSLLAVSALLFIKLDWILFFISDKPLLQFFTIFFTKAYNVFLISFITGLIILALGILLKFFGIGFKISEFFSRFQKKDIKEKIGERISKKEIKEIVKKEVSESKKKK